VIRRTCAVASLWAAATASGEARAETRAIDVAAEGCPDLHAEEVERILEIELASVSGHWTGPERMRVELVCHGPQLTIVAVDPVTDKRLSRELTVGPHVADRDRTVALLVSQLFLTSWTELLLTPPAEAAPLRTATPPPLVARAAEKMARSALEPPAVTGALAAVAGPRVRDWSAPVVGVRAALRPSLLVGRHLRAFVELAYERGSADRAGGTVGYSFVSAAAGVGWRPPSLGPVVFDLAASAGPAYVDVQGNPSQPTVAGASTSGAVAELAIAAGPSVVVGPTRIGLELSVGETVPRAVAHVAADKDVSLGGLWASVCLVLGTGDGRP
jgi:hypothetical protein